MSARYDTFVILAESLQWDETVSGHLGAFQAAASDDSVPPGAAARAARVHRSRLRVVDMKFF